MRFFTSQRPRFGILIASCFFPVFVLFRVLVFFLIFFMFLFTVSGKGVFCVAFVSFLLPCLVWCVATFLQPTFSNIATNVCKAFLQEYGTFDFGASGPNRTPTRNTEGKATTKKNGKKWKTEQVKNRGKNRTSSEQPQTTTEIWKNEKNRAFGVFYPFFLPVVYLFFFLCCSCVVPVFFLFFSCFFLLFLLFFSPLPRGCCFCARRPWRPKSLMQFLMALGNWIWAALCVKRMEFNSFF